MTFWPHFSLFFQPSGQVQEECVMLERFESKIHFTEDKFFCVFQHKVYKMCSLYYFVIYTGNLFNI